MSNEGQYCLGTSGKGEAVYCQELFAPNRATIVEEGEYPQWFFDALTDPSTYDAMLRQAVEPGGDWGTAAELHIEARELQAHIDSLHYQEEQCHRRLLASHKYKSYTLFRKLRDKPLLRGDKNLTPLSSPQIGLPLLSQGYPSSPTSFYQCAQTRTSPMPYISESPPCLHINCDLPPSSPPQPSPILDLLKRDTGDTFVPSSSPVEISAYYQPLLSWMHPGQDFASIVKSLSGLSP
ncbi:hypothetical protein BJV74DRAFT_888578 [Russula compacta]|nr:hypothetical protein BJV74DRAFT_888578 [Russula compacta]